MALSIRLGAAGLRMATAIGGFLQARTHGQPDDTSELEAARAWYFEIEKPQ